MRRLVRRSCLAGLREQAKRALGTGDALGAAVAAWEADPDKSFDGLTRVLDEVFESVGLADARKPDVTLNGAAAS